MTAAPRVVYRLYDGRSRLLYVGCTSNLVNRLRTHRSVQPWWPLVCAVTTEGPMPSDVALRREARVISTECPTYNTVHNPRRLAPEPAEWIDLAKSVAERTGWPVSTAHRAISAGQLPQDRVATNDELTAWIANGPRTRRSAEIYSGILARVYDARRTAA